MRKGQAIGVDYAVAIGIFVLSIFAGFYYISVTFAPQTPFHDLVDSSAFRASREFEDKVKWEVEKVPVKVQTSYNLTNYTIELDFVFPKSADKNSSLVMHENSEIRSQINFSANTTLIVQNITAGTNWYNLVYTENTNLSDRNYTSNLSLSGMKASNGEINVTFDNKGILSLKYRGLEYLNDSMDLSGSSSPVVSDGTLKAEFHYEQPNEKTGKVFARSKRIEFNLNLSSPDSWDINLTNNFSELYVSDGDQNIDLDDNGTLYSGTTDWLDFYNLTGISFFSDNMNAEVYRNSSHGKIQLDLEIGSSNEKAIIYLHEGNYTNAKAQNQSFHNPPSYSVLTPVSKKGISRKKLSEWENSSYESMKNYMGLSGLDYNITYGNLLSYGREIPIGQDVAVFQYKLPMLTRFGNVSLERMKLAVWSGPQ